MTLQASGPISLSQVNTELGRSATATISLGESAVRTLFGVASGAISMSQGYGKSNITAQGIWMGGSTASGATVTTIDRLLYSNDTNAAVSATLVEPRGHIAAVTSKLKGYFIGGIRQDFTVATEIDGFDFQTSTATNPAAVASATSYSFTGGLNSTTAGYRLGSGSTTNVDKFVFSTETFNTAITTAALAKSMSGYLSATSVNKGYAYGGTVPGPKGSSTPVNNIQGINFSSDTTFTTSAVAVLTGLRYFAFNGGSIGYTTNGKTAGVAIEGLTYSTETAANTGYVLSTAVLPDTYAFQSHYSQTKGYSGGGLLTNNRTNIIAYMQFSNGTNGTLSATLSSARALPGATQSAYV